MALGNTETWFWRFIGICALGVCTLNVMVLMRGHPTSVERTAVDSLQSNKISFMQVATSQKVIDKQNVVLGQLDAASAATQAKKPEVPAKPVGKQQKPNAAQVAESVKRLPFLWVQVSAFLKPEQTMLIGKKRPGKSFLVIGVPTVKRSKAYYLMDTVQGLISGLSKEEQSEVVIVVFVADFDVGFRNKVKNDLLNRFRPEVENGLVQAVVAPIGYYPSMKNLPLLYGDSLPRVVWRSKQSLDYSFLYFHCADLGQYFLQLEDDVLTEDNYLPKIKSFINSRTNKWSTLEFGARGFIGMMYEAKNLESLAKYCRMNFFLMPVDWLFRVYNDIWLYGNEKGNVRRPPLFKHIGTFSSLDGQVRKLEDIAGGAVLAANPRVHKDASNPKAIVDSSITEYVPNYPIDKAYVGGNFWGKKITTGDYIRLTFDKPTLLKRFVVISGSPTYPSDALENSEVFISAAPSGICETYRSVFKAIDKPTVDTGVLDIGHPIKCVKLMIDSIRKDDHGRPRWLVIREIDVWTP